MTPLAAKWKNNTSHALIFLFRQQLVINHLFMSAEGLNGREQEVTN